MEPDSDSVKRVDASETPAPTRHWLRESASAFEGLSIGLPERTQILIDHHDKSLTPSPCQSQHTLAAALSHIGSSSPASAVAVDPSFPPPLENES